MNRNIILSTIAAIGIILAIPHVNLAQSITPQLFITWKTNTLAPANYAGKVLPTANSVVNATAELFYKGAPVDLSKQTIYWYVDDELVPGNSGGQSVTFKTPQFAGGSVDLRAQIPNFQNNLVVKTVEIPVSRPVAVIEAPFPNYQVGTSFTVIGTPYFFNAKNLSDLVLSWMVNGNQPDTSENPDALTVHVNQSGNTRIDISFKNPQANLEFANQSVVLHTQ